MRDKKGDEREMDIRLDLFGVPFILSVLSTATWIATWFASMAYLSKVSSQGGWEKISFVVTQGFLASVLIVLSVCLHELGHALVGSLLGLQVTGSGMSFWGAYVNFAQRVNLITPQNEIAVAFAGPGVNLAIFIIAGIQFLGNGTIRNHTAGCVAVTNLTLALSNLLPVFLFSIGGLDGGYVADGIIRLNEHDLVKANTDRVLLDAASILLALTFAHFARPRRYE